MSKQVRTAPTAREMLKSRTPRRNLKHGTPVRILDGSEDLRGTHATVVRPDPGPWGDNREIVKVEVPSGEIYDIPRAWLDI